MFLRPRLNWLAVFIPVSFLLAYIPGWKNDSFLFISASRAMIVVSAWIGDATEKLAVVVGPTWGGMLNAAFGNLPDRTSPSRIATGEAFIPTELFSV